MCGATTGSSEDETRCCFYYFLLLRPSCVVELERSRVGPANRAHAMEYSYNENREFFDSESVALYSRGHEIPGGWTTWECLEVVVVNGAVQIGLTTFHAR